MWIWVGHVGFGLLDGRLVDGWKEIGRSSELRIQLQTVSHIVGNKSTIESDV
jgi:hypothetical protein